MAVSQIEDIVLGWRFLGSANCKDRCSVSRGSELDKQALFPPFIRKSDPWPTRSEFAVSCDCVTKHQCFHWVFAGDMMSPIQAVGLLPLRSGHKSHSGTSQQCKLEPHWVGDSFGCTGVPNLYQTGASWAFGQTALGRFVLTQNASLCIRCKKGPA